MARIAVIAVVEVIGHTCMVGVRHRLPMTSQAVEYGIIGGIRMAIAASVGTSVVRGEPTMVEGRPRPLSGGVTVLARCRESCRRMVRIGYRLILASMAGIAICGCS